MAQSAWRLHDVITGMHKTAHRLAKASVLASLAFVLVGCSSGQTDSTEQSRTLTPEAVNADAHGDAAALYDQHCATCHDGTVEQAPRRAALAVLSSERILAAMDTGIMQPQSAMLSPEQRVSIANLLSEVSATADQAGGGMCDRADTQAVVSRQVRVADWGLDPENSRYFDDALTEIDADNAQGLELDWAFAFPGAARARVQPTIAGDTLFTADQNGTIYALDVDSGCIRWQAKIDAEIRSALVVAADESGNATTLYFGDISGSVHALDIETRSVLWSVRADPHPATRITGTLRLHEGRLFVPVSSMEVVSAMDDSYECCTFRGSVLALDVQSGEKIWQTYTTPPPVKQGLSRVGTQLYAPSGAPVWTSPAIDDARGVLYVGTGENYTRPASGLSDAILAMSLDDGALVWSFQALADDAWNAACSAGANCPEDTGPDYDFGASPILTTTAEGRSLVLAGQKSGWVYALDPDRNGEVVWTNKVGRGGIMGGVHWGMALEGDTLFVPISDRAVYAQDAHLPAQSGMHAVDVKTGATKWSHLLEDHCEDVDWVCSGGISAAASAAPGVIAGGSLDGMVRVFSAKNGDELWSFDTNRAFDAANSVAARGGAIESDGPVFAGPRMFVTSGYDNFSQIPGNVLLAFRLSGGGDSAEVSR